MDKNTQYYSVLLKLFAIGFPLMAAIAVGFVLYMNSISAKAIAPFINVLTERDSSVVICGSVDLKPEELIKSFESHHYSKASGSHPSEFYKLDAESSSSSENITVGQDSSDQNLFWLYSDRSAIQGMSLGYIKSKYIASKVSECGKTHS